MVWHILGDKQMTGCGVTTVALQRLVRIAFQDLGLERLYAWIIDDNTPSRRLLEKRAFAKPGRSAAQFRGARSGSRASTST